MDRGARLTAEVQVLGTLCRWVGTYEQRQELEQILERYEFLEPEHQIVFGSIRALHMKDQFPISMLAVHLNNRGFPDVDLDKYSAPELGSVDDALKLARRLVSISRAAEDVR